jgi:sulfur dioxygenase
LPHPKQIDIALPANLRCGRPENDDVAEHSPTWAPLKLTFAGLWEMDPLWLEENLNEVQILDVRETEEFNGPLGHIQNALHVPLGELASRSAEINPAIPVVAVCRAGARSAQAIVILKRAGLTDCANLAGGMLRWRDRGYPVIGGVN